MGEVGSTVSGTSDLDRKRRATDVDQSVEQTESSVLDSNPSASANEEKKSEITAENSLESAGLLTPKSDAKSVTIDSSDMRPITPMLEPKPPPGYSKAKTKEKGEGEEEGEHVQGGKYEGRELARS